MSYVKNVFIHLKIVWNVKENYKNLGFVFLEKALCRRL